MKLLILFALMALSFQNTFADTLESRLDKAITSGLDEKRIVGAVVMVSRDGKLIYNKAHGFSDREAKTPMTTDSLFRLASITKPIVTVAVLKLIDQGKIRIDDSASKWIPELNKEITIRHLLTHTAGLNYTFFEVQDGPYHTLRVSDGLDKADITLEENIKRIALAPLLFKPGTQWSYSLATDVLGEILTRIEKKELGAIIDEQVLKPLQMNDSGFFAKDAGKLTAAYVDAKPEPKRMAETERFKFAASEIVYSPGRALAKKAYPSGGAGMVGTPADLLKFFEDLRTGSTLLNKNSHEALTTNQVGSLNVDGPGWGWSLGFKVLTDADEAKSPMGKGSYEWGGVWGHTWWVDPVNKLTVLILTNTAVEGMSGKLPSDIKKAVYADDD